MSRIAAAVIVLFVLVMNAVIVLEEHATAPVDTKCTHNADGTQTCGLGLINFLVSVATTTVTGIDGAGAIVNGFYFLIVGLLLIVAIIVLIVG